MKGTAVGGASAARRFASLAIEALRGIRGPQIGAAMLLGLALTAWGSTVFMEAISHIARTMPFGRLLLRALIADQVKALCLLVAIVIADRAVDEGAGRRRTYLLAALAGCVAGIALTTPFDWFWRTYMLPDRWPENFAWLHGTRAHFYWPIFFLTQWLLVGSAVVFLYADRRAARRTAQLLHDAELDRVRRSRIALESRLQALQARVEPQFLFDTLDQVGRLYELDPPLAARVLDELITYLRAAMPHMRDASSTVRQEFALARAYLDIRRVGLGGALAVRFDCDDQLASGRMPPMMLLPLLERALALCGEQARTTIDLAVRRDDAQLVICVRFRGAARLRDDDEVIRAIQERLAALYGQGATFALGAQDAGTTQARLELPFDSAVAPATLRERERSESLTALWRP